MIPLLRALWLAFTSRPATAAEPLVPPSGVFVVGPGGVITSPVPLVRREPCQSCDRVRTQLDEANDYIERLWAVMRAHGLRVEVLLADEQVAS